jgi:hypothetical protein
MNPKDCMEAIKNALNAYELESVSAVKSLPIQEHREFPNWGGPCEAYQFDIKLKYPATTIAVQQVLKERAGINSDWMHVRTLHEAEYTDAAEARGKDHDGALLDETELKDEPGAQELVGQARIGSLLKLLDQNTRKYETAGADTNADGVREAGSTKGETTNNAKKVPQGNTSEIGSTKNKLQGKRGQ